MKRREKTISNPLTVCVECSNFQISCWLVWNTIKDLLKKKKILKFLRQNYVNGTDLKEEQVTVSLRKLSNSTRRSFNNLWKFKFLSIFSLWNALELVSMVNGTMSIVFVASVRFHKPRQRHCSAITHCTTVLIIPFFTSRVIERKNHQNVGFLMEVKSCHLKNLRCVVSPMKNPVWNFKVVGRRFKSIQLGRSTRSVEKSMKFFHCCNARRKSSKPNKGKFSFIKIDMKKLENSRIAIRKFPLEAEDKTTRRWCFVSSLYIAVSTTILLCL